MTDFQLGDVVVEIGWRQKYVVSHDAGRDYVFKPCCPFTERRTATRIIPKEEASGRFVKTGTWDFKNSMEVDDDGNTRDTY